MLHSPRNLQENLCRIAHQTFDVSLHYLAKYKKNEIGEILLHLTQ